MSCNSVIHDELKGMGHLVCNFCDKQITDHKSKQEDSCCNNINLINNKGMNICSNFSVVNGYDVVNDCIFMKIINLGENRYYHRKYHIFNSIFMLFNLTRYEHMNLINDFCKVEQAMSQLFTKKQ